MQTFSAAGPFGFTAIIHLELTSAGTIDRLIVMPTDVPDDNLLPDLRNEQLNCTAVMWKTI